MSKTLSVLLAVIIMIILAGIGYYYLNKNFQDQKADLQKQIDQSKSANATSSETADWKTYSSTDLGFSFKYPAAWILDTESTKDGIVYLLTQDRKTKLDNNEKVRVFDVMFQKFDSTESLPNNATDKLSLKSWVEDGYSEVKSVNIGNLSGYTGTAKTGAGTLSYIIFVQKDSNVYQIEVSDITTPDKTQQQVLDSFKFL